MLRAPRRAAPSLHAQLAPEEADELQRAQQAQAQALNGGGLQYEHESLAGAEAMLAAGGASTGSTATMSMAGASGTTSTAGAPRPIVGELYFEYHRGTFTSQARTKRGNRAGLQAGLLLTFLMGLVFLLTQAREYSRVGFAPHDGAFGTIFYCLTGLHGAHVFVGLSILLFMTIRAFRGHFSPEHHHGVEIGGIYWHFVDVMWIVVFTTVYIL